MTCAPVQSREGTSPGPVAAPLTWAILTGEYPPQRGGVADYTRLLAHSLAAQGDQVHVWAPDCPGAGSESGIQVHRLPGHYGPKALAQLSRDLKELPDSARLLVQYVPHAYGYKAMNVPFALWLAARKQPLWVMYHEVAYPIRRGQPLKHNALGLVTRGMASAVARKAERIFISIPGWENLLPKSAPKIWLPVPSNIPTTANPQRVQQIRERYAPQGELLIGHFGTYGAELSQVLHELLPGILERDSRRKLLLLGHGSDRFRQELNASGDRVHSTGALPGEELAAHLSACDLMIQPYPDGVSTRRGSMMAALALGLPIVTTQGPLTEPIWTEARAAAFLPQLEELLASPQLRREIGHNAATVYRERFDIANTIQELRRELRS